ncbi:cell division protein FtsA [Sandaracinobacteroides saxicola]|uniref:Cell division protein FtsA n=1 Tax=Sandaracinobacteroides saxicola TaxID=2759707 RepID=A0A7G5IG79_9SPHN|nr:cell division protein FtsA [Sandaracinobacteroides saxicola]QMW22371.1 cell division protein FtsA [Sandaracinobacteroides saxicola]
MAVAALSPAKLNPGNLLKPRGERLVAALDVGTSKVAALIAIADGENPPRVIGAGVRACNGLRRGLVADMARTETAVRAAMDQAERAAGLEIESVLVNLSAGGLDSDVAPVEIDIAGHRIEDADVATLLAAGRARIEANDRLKGRTILHAEPTLYTIDGVDGVTNPRGFHANRLAVDIHVITADTPPCRNLDLAVRNAHLNVESIVAAGVASSLSILGQEERELGVAVVEIGAGVTTVAVHGGGMLLGLAAIPMGAADITADIATNFACARSAAERLKTLHGAATASPRDNHEMIEIPPLETDDSGESRRVAKAELIAVIRSRADLLFREVAQALGEMGFHGSAGRQVVLTGGGAELRGVADFAQGALARNVRLGRPRGLIGLPEAQSGAAFAALVGLIHYGATSRIDLARTPPRASSRAARGPETQPGRFARLFQQLKTQI